MILSWTWQFYSVVCRVATILKTRYTAPGFWLAGLSLFEEAESLISGPSEKAYLKNCINGARDQLHQADNSEEASQSAQSRGPRASHLLFFCLL